MFLPSKVKVVKDNFSERFQKNIQQNHPVKSLKQIILLIIPLLIYPVDQNFQIRLFQFIIKIIRMIMIQMKLRI